MTRPSDIDRVVRRLTQQPSDVVFRIVNLEDSTDMVSFTREMVWGMKSRTFRKLLNDEAAEENKKHGFLCEVVTYFQTGDGYGFKPNTRHRTSN